MQLYTSKTLLIERFGYIVGRATATPRQTHKTKTKQFKTRSGEGCFYLANIAYKNPLLLKVGRGTTLPLCPPTVSNIPVHMKQKGHSPVGWTC